MDDSGYFSVQVYIYIYIYMRISKNHNSLGCEQPLGLDVNQSPDAQDTFQPIYIVYMYMYIHEPCIHCILVDSWELRARSTCLQITLGL